MKVKLTLRERITMIALLPMQGNWFQLRFIEDVRKDVAFSETEMEEHGITLIGDQINWKKTSLTYEKEVNLGNFCMEKVKERILKLHKENKLDEAIVSIAKKVFTEKELSEQFAKTDEDLAAELKEKELRNAPTPPAGEKSPKTDEDVKDKSPLTVVT